MVLLVTRRNGHDPELPVSNESKKYSHIPYSFAYSPLISLEIYLLHTRMQTYRIGIIQRVSSVFLPYGFKAEKR